MVLIDFAVNLRVPHGLIAQLPVRLPDVTVFAKFTQMVALLSTVLDIELEN